MSGILDSKSRVIDTILTLEGRRQLSSNGGLSIRYVSFSDAATFYSADAVSGSQDATSRVYLEAGNLPQDAITFQADAPGAVVASANDAGLQVAGGRIIKFNVSASLQSSHALQGQEFVDAADKVLASSLQNFQKLQVLSSIDALDDEGFAAGPEAVTFTLSERGPITNVDARVAHVTALRSIFNDPRFSHLANFKFLPPINRLDENDTTIDRSDVNQLSTHLLGAYAPWAADAAAPLTFSDLQDELRGFEAMGCMQVINFDPTSSDNRLVGQLFERSYDQLRKLDVIDYGVHRTGRVDAPLAHVFFAGKIIVDDHGVDTFLHLFTLLFE